MKFKKNEFQYYYLNVRARNSFSNYLEVCNVSAEINVQFIELKNDIAARDIYHNTQYSIGVTCLKHSHKYLNRHF